MYSNHRIHLEGKNGSSNVNFVRFVIKCTNNMKEYENISYKTIV